MVPLARVLRPGPACGLFTLSWMTDWMTDWIADTNPDWFPVGIAPF
jgi:hypothetical protein